MIVLLAIIRKTLLVKEIISQDDVLHFQRYRVLETPWFNIYVHRICQSDNDLHMHDHPWDFTSLILSGSYEEQTTLHPKHNFIYIRRFLSGELVEHHAEDVHKITLRTPEVWTLVFTSGRERVWGYRLSDGSWIDFKTYRQLKRAGRLPE